MARKRIGDAAGSITTDVVLIAGAAVGAYFLVVKPLLSKLGLDTGTEGQKSLPPAQDPFNYQFQPFIDFYDQNPPTVSGGGFWSSLFGGDSQNPNPTIQQFFQSLQSNPPTVSPWGLLDVPRLSQLAITLSENLGGFTVLSNDDQTARMANLQQLTDQFQVAFIANYFWWNFGEDLLSELSKKYGGLTAENLAFIVDHIDHLPLHS